MGESQIKIYQVDNGKTEITVKLDYDTVWLNLMQLTELFGRDKSVISRHIRNIFIEKELDRYSTVAKFATVQNEGGREIERNIDLFGKEKDDSFRSSISTIFQTFNGKDLYPSIEEKATIRPVLHTGQRHGFMPVSLWNRSIVVSGIFCFFIIASMSGGTNCNSRLHF